VGIAFAALIFFGFIVPLLLLGSLRGRASYVLDTGHHASVTVAILTTGYRLQLTRMEAEQLVRKQLLEAGPSKTETATATDNDNSQVLRIAREVSKRMEARCCGLAKYIPSHGFGLVRQMQTVLVLCALWLTVAPGARAGVIISTLLASSLLTHTVQPYAIAELNKLDITACAAVVLHTGVALSGAWEQLQWLVWPIHAVVLLLLLLCVIRGASQKARTVFVALNRRLRQALPALQRLQPKPGAGDAGDDGVQDSALPGLGAISGALGERLGCMKAGTRPIAAPSLGRAASNWRIFASSAATALSTSGGGVSQLVAAMVGSVSDASSDARLFAKLDGGGTEHCPSPVQRKHALSPGSSKSAGTLQLLPGGKSSRSIGLGQPPLGDAKRGVMGALDSSRRNEALSFGQMRVRGGSFKRKGGDGGSAHATAYSKASTPSGRPAGYSFYANRSPTAAVAHGAGTQRSATAVHSSSATASGGGRGSSLLRRAHSQLRLQQHEALQSSQSAMTEDSKRRHPRSLRHITSNRGAVAAAALHDGST